MQAAKQATAARGAQASQTQPSSRHVVAPTCWVDGAACIVGPAVGAACQVGSQAVHGAAPGAGVQPARAARERSGSAGQGEVEGKQRRGGTWRCAVQCAGQQATTQATVGESKKGGRTRGTAPLVGWTAQQGRRALCASMRGVGSPNACAASPQATLPALTTTITAALTAAPASAAAGRHPLRCPTACPACCCCRCACRAHRPCRPPRPPPG